MTVFQTMLRLAATVVLAVAFASDGTGAARPDVTAESANPPISLADYTLTNWSEEQGPFPFGIYAIAQDQEGYLWLGARTGLVRFDGTEFVVWHGRQALPDDRVAAILAASDGSLWVGFGTVGGVAQIVGGTARRFTAKDGVGEGDVNAIDQDPGGNLIPWAELQNFNVEAGRLILHAKKAFWFTNSKGFPLKDIPNYVALIGMLRPRGANDVPSTSDWAAAAMARSGRN